MIVGLIVLLYSLAWFVLSTILHHYATEALDNLNDGQRSVVCENLRKSGYPLRIALRCDRIQWQDRLSGFAMMMGTVIAGAPVYAPSWRRLEIAAPARFEQEGAGIAEAEWRHLTVNADFSAEDLHDLTITIEKPQLALRDEQGIALPLSLKADFFRFRLNAGSDRQINTELSFDDLELTPLMNGPQSQLPTISGEIQMGVELATTSPRQEDWPDRLRDSRGRLEKVDLQFDGGGFHLEGDFYLSSTGQISAQLMLNLRESAALLRSLRTIFPEQSYNLDSLFFAINAMPKNEAGEPLIPIHIDEGRVRAGFIPLGTLPSL